MKTKEEIKEERRIWWINNKNVGRKERNERKRKWRKEHPLEDKKRRDKERQKKTEYMREWRKNNAEKWSNYNKSWRAKNIVKVKGDRLQKDFSITLEEYIKLVKSQDGKCAICGGIQKGKRLSVDHDHNNKNIRGLLCMKCNTGLGLFNDNIELLKSATKYLSIYN